MKLGGHTTVNYRIGGIVIKIQLKRQLNTKIQIWRRDSWDVIGIWANVNN